MRRVAYISLVCALTAAICLCGYELWKISDIYSGEERIKEEMLEYRPAAAEDSGERAEAASAPEQDVDIAGLRNEVNSDVVGWLSIPNTKIDYPFVIASDNSKYLRRDLHGNYALAGSLFMDYLSTPDFSGFNNIIYGHNMKNQGMFGDLILFSDANFFEENPSGTLFLQDATCSLEFFAYMVVSADDRIIYDSSASRDQFFEYVKQNARVYREPETSGSIVTLSTCSYEYNDARIVLLANLVR